ncbi:ribonuclease III [Roseomonas eburnea]|uniref:Ribonuclease 3 n=1 Tax=Neoroseomonas eburnea TaxID=1346889 RepID=A0A9X9XJ54_9PROT|nr:ribonuclease III [Neoroseomonas eburnea]MBR0683740.1 ribonuclease III [Neoroseomonas eburnea]
MSGIEERLGHRFADPALLAQALTHRSAADARGGQLDSNERLEFLGDRVLGLVIAEWLSDRYPEEREGNLTRRLSALVAWETLARVGEAIGLAEALRIPPGEERAGLRARQTVMADAVEALLGAIYLDGGLDAARAVIRRHWAALLEAAAKPPVSAKNRLQEYTLGRGLGLPAYRLVSAAGPSHAPFFVVAVSAAGREAEGSGETKRAAELAAAEAWLAGVTP